MFSENTGMNMGTRGLGGPGPMSMSMSMAPIPGLAWDLDPQFLLP